MCRILYSEQSCQNIHCTLSSVSYIVFSQMFTATEDKEKKLPSFILRGFSVETMPQVIFVASDTFKCLKV